MNEQDVTSYFGSPYWALLSIKSIYDGYAFLPVVSGPITMIPENKTVSLGVYPRLESTLSILVVWLLEDITYALSAKRGAEYQVLGLISSLSKWYYILHSRETIDCSGILGNSRLMLWLCLLKKLSHQSTTVIFRDVLFFSSWVIRAI